MQLWESVLRCKSTLRCAAMRLSLGRAPLNKLFASLSFSSGALSLLLGRHARASATRWPHLGTGAAQMLLLSGSDLPSAQFCVE